MSFSHSVWKETKKLRNSSKIGILNAMKMLKLLRFLWLFFSTPYVKELCGCLHYWTTEVLRKNFRFQSLFAWWITIWDFIFTLFDSPSWIFSWKSKVLPIKQILQVMFWHEKSNFHPPNEKKNIRIFLFLRIFLCMYFISLLFFNSFFFFQFFIFCNFVGNQDVFCKKTLWIKR